MIYEHDQAAFIKQVKRTFNTVLQHASALSKATHTTGFRIPFAKRPPLTRRLASLSKFGGAVEDKLLEEKWQELVQLGHATQLKEEDDSPGFYCRSFTIAKKAKKERRLINDTRPLNKYVKHFPVKIPGLQKAINSVRKNDYMAVFDVKNGYYNVPIDKDHQKYFRFNCNGKTFQMRSLPMGFVSSMEAFRSYMAPFINTLKILFPSTQIFAYVDDVLLCCQGMTKKAARMELQKIHLAIRTMGLPLKAAKSHWEPTRKVGFLGFELNSKDLTITVPIKKLKAVKKQVSQTLRRGRTGKLRLRHLATTIGQVMALLPACPEGRLHSRNLYMLQTKTVKKMGWQGDTIVHLTTATKAELSWWETFLNAQRFRPLDVSFRCAELAITATDASDHSIGGVLLSHHKLPHFSVRLSRKLRREHINTKELRAVWEAIQRFEPHVKGTLLNVRSDSMVVIHALNKWGTKQQQLIPLLVKIFRWCLKTHTKLTATYVSTHANVYADKLSRSKKVTRIDVAEAKLFKKSIQAARRRDLHWKISKEGMRHLRKTMKIKPRTNLTHTDTYSSEAILPWFIPSPTKVKRGKNRGILCFPDLNKVDKALQTILRMHLSATLIVPLWAQAPWFSQIARMAVSRPVILPANSIQPVNQRSHSLPTWKWISVKVSALKKRRIIFRRQLDCRIASAHVLNVETLYNKAWKQLRTIVQQDTALLKRVHAPGSQSEILTGILAAYADSISSKGLSLATYQSAQSAVSHFLQASKPTVQSLLRIQATNKNYKRKHPAGPRNDSLPDIHRMFDIALELAKDQTQKGTRQHLIILLLLLSSRRMSDIARIWRDERSMVFAVIQLDAPRWAAKNEGKAARILQELKLLPKRKLKPNEFVAFKFRSYMGKTCAINGKRFSSWLQLTENREDDRLCPVLAVAKYLKATQKFSIEHSLKYDSNCIISSITDNQGKNPRSAAPLLVSLNGSPRKGLQSSTISGLVRRVITIPLKMEFTPHILRACSSSYKRAYGVSEGVVKAVGEWSNEATFNKFYFRVVNTPVHPSRLAGVQMHDWVLAHAHTLARSVNSSPSRRKVSSLTRLGSS